MDKWYSLKEGCHNSKNWYCTKAARWLEQSPHGGDIVQIFKAIYLQLSRQNYFLTVIQVHETCVSMSYDASSVEIQQMSRDIHQHPLPSAVKSLHVMLQHLLVRSHASKNLIFFSFTLWIIISVAISRWGNIFANRSHRYQVRISRECNSTLTEALNINLSTRIDIIVVPKILDILGPSFNIGISLLPYIHYCVLHILVYLHLYP